MLELNNSAEDDNLFTSKLDNIHKSNQMLEQLQTKLNGFFKNRKQSPSDSNQRQQPAQQEFVVQKSSLPASNSEKPSSQFTSNKRTQGSREQGFRHSPMILIDKGSLSNKELSNKQDILLKTTNPPNNYNLDSRQGEQRRNILQSHTNSVTHLKQKTLLDPAHSFGSANKNVNAAMDSQFKSRQVTQMDSMEAYYKKKTALIQAKKTQLQQQIQIQNQEKILLFKQNQRLQQDLKNHQDQLNKAKVQGKEEETGYDGSNQIDQEIQHLQKQLKQAKDKTQFLKSEVKSLKAISKQLGGETSRNTNKSERQQNSVLSKMTDDRNASFKQIEALKRQLQIERENHQKLKNQVSKGEDIELISNQLKKLKMIVTAKIDGKKK